MIRVELLVWRGRWPGLAVEVQTRRVTLRWAGWPSLGEIGRDGLVGIGSSATYWGLRVGPIVFELDRLTDAA